MEQTERTAGIRSLSKLVWGPVVSVQTYKRAIYLLLAIPIGFFYSMIFGFSLVAGIALSVVLVGLLILAISLVFVHLFSRFERWLANRLLAVDIAMPDETVSQESFRGTIRSLVSAPSTWRGLGFLTLKFWLTIVGILVLFGFATAVSLIRSVLERPRDVEFGEVNGEPVVWSVETVPEAALAGIAGILLLVLFLHLANLFGYVAGRMASALLA